MALFFDQEWFDAKLAATGAGREDIGQLLRLSPEQVADLWKDQRELKAADVLVIARFLNVSAEEVALRAGISTPRPLAGVQDVTTRLAAMEARMTAIEQAILEMKAAFDRLAH